MSAQEANKIDVKSMLGDAVRRGGASRALAALDAQASELGGALRRSVPVLLRRGVAFHATPARITRPAELAAEMTGPTFDMPLVTDPGGSRALLSFSGAATSFLVDAALGGGDEPESSDPAPQRPDITAPQRAVMMRIAIEMVGAVSDVLAGTGLRLRRIPTAPETTSGAELVVVKFRIGDAPDRVIALAMSRDALQTSATTTAANTRSGDAAPRVAAALGRVEVQLVLELGRIRRSLMSIERLRLGDVVRLDTPVRTPLVVRCEERPLFFALPTAVGTQLAMSILDRIDGPGPQDDVVRVEVTPARAVIDP